MQRQIEQDARNALLTIQAVQQQREMMLSRKADLLATLAYLRNGDATRYRTPAKTHGSPVIATCLRSRTDRARSSPCTRPVRDFTVTDAEKLFRSSLKDDSAAGWWFGGRHLFQVVMQPYYEDEARKGRRLGTVVVGRELDARGASDLGRISSSHLIFRHGNDLMMTTLALAKEGELERQLRDHPTGEDYPNRRTAIFHKFHRPGFR